ncbi:hypothetical protein E4U41_006925 [Claviceps citrina]|nr:hypothetical protein E4U41_006925 [Claviceps citrina]
MPPTDQHAPLTSPSTSTRLEMPSAVPLDTFRADRPLAESIALATRPLHAKLNKIIMARLPRALPPLATNPLVYASGLMHIAPIFTTFEAAWSDVLDEPGPSSVSQHLLQTLQLLHLPGLMRAARLEGDIRSMMGWTQDVARERLGRVGETGHLHEFVSHIRRVVKSKPHVLLSYSYIFFMALFAGGRFIRATLESAGDEFWQAPRQREDSQAGQHSGPGSPPPTTTTTTKDGIPTPLGFFHFDTPSDGEDLKRDFKRRLADADKFLSCQEKHDIVQEAVCIFQNMLLVVAQVDDSMAAGGDAAGPPPSSSSAGGLGSADSSPVTVVLNRFRDSVAVTKERYARRRSSQERLVMRGSGGSEANESCIAGDDGTTTTPAALMGEATPWSDKPDQDNHPIMASAGTEIRQGAACGLPASSLKAVRFEKRLPQPGRGPGGGAGNSAGGGGGGELVAEKIGVMASRRLHREQVTNWAMGVVVAFLILGAGLSGRWAVY